MRYIKAYENHYNNSSIKDEIIDILSDITDDGFFQRTYMVDSLRSDIIVNIHKCSLKQPGATHHMWNSSGLFCWSDVKQSIDKLVNNLSDRYNLFSCIICTRGHDHEICKDGQIKYDVKLGIREYDENEDIIMKIKLIFK